MNDKPMTVDALMENTRLAWYLGQRYWQQADSESYADNKRSALTFEKFNKLLESSRAAIEQYGREHAAPQPREPLTEEQIENLILEKHFRNGYERRTSDGVCLAWYRLGVRDAEIAHNIRS